MTPDNLLPCPFCGGEPYMQNIGGVLSIGCEGCYCVMQNCSCIKENAIKIWNCRTPAAASANASHLLSTVHKSINKHPSAPTVHKSINKHPSAPSVHKSINEHLPSQSTAGRKTIITRRLYHDVMMHHKNNTSIRNIIHIISAFNGIRLSVGTVHKIINMPAPAEQLDDQLTINTMETVAI